MQSRRRYERHYVPDARDRDYPIRRLRTTRTSRYWDTGGLVLDQGDSPHCVGYALAAWLHAAPVRQFLDPDGIYFNAQLWDEWEGIDYEGTSVRGGMKFFKSIGLVGEYRWARTVGQVVNTLLTRGPMVLGTTWYPGMDEPDPRGELRLTGDPLGGHAYVGIGVDTIRRRVRVLNNWGPDWGERGRAWLPYDALEQLLAEDGEAAIATEVRPIARQAAGRKRARYRLAA